MVHRGYAVQMESSETGTPEPRLSGRRAQALRNDSLIRQAARDVFTANPDAPMSAVAKRAGVGISALYRRFGVASRGQLLGEILKRRSHGCSDQLLQLLLGSSGA